MIQRIAYLSRLAKLREKRPVKLLSGVRGGGKTTLLAHYIDWLKRSGVTDPQIIFIDMENPESESLLRYQGLYSYIKKRLYADNFTYIFIDEIQLCVNFEKAIAGLLVKNNIDIYMTASSAGQTLGTVRQKHAKTFSGIPYMEIPVLPLSFAEHQLFSKARARAGEPPLHSAANAKIERRLPRQKEQMEKFLRREAFTHYASFGGFPFTLALGGAELIRPCVDGIYNTIVIREIAGQPSINNIPLLESIAKIMARSLGRPLSSKKISAVISRGGRKISCNTVEAYMRALCSAFVFYHIGRYDIKAGKNLKTLGKYYIADMGICNLRLGSAAQDAVTQNALLENIVCMELLRRGFTVCVGKYGREEINFAAFSQSVTHNENTKPSAGPAYFQVMPTIRDKPAYTRKFSALERIRDNGPKTILSLDETLTRQSRNGILHQNLIEWLLT